MARTVPCGVGQSDHVNSDLLYFDKNILGKLRKPQTLRYATEPRCLFTAGINLSSNYLHKVINTPDYVQKMIQNNRTFSSDEFYLTELKTGELADRISQWLIDSGYNAYSHSDKNQIETGFFDGIYERTPLPHKTIARIARIAGIGWIGKNNLLVTPKPGSALCLGVVITNAAYPPYPSRCLMEMMLILICFTIRQ